RVSIRSISSGPSWMSPCAASRINFPNMTKHCRIPCVSVRLFCLIGRSSNGRTADSDSAYRGSNPCLPVQLTMRSPVVLLVLMLSFAGNLGAQDEQTSQETPTAQDTAKPQDP